MNAKTSGRAPVVSIQYLRGLSALAVALFHTSVNLPGFAWPDFLGREFGDAGVDVFFVISGFVMLYVTHGADLTPRTFLLRRAIRIAPLYWVMNLVVVCLALFLAVGKTDEIVFSHVLQSMLFLPHFNPASGSIVPLLKPGFTLNYEVYFYLLFAILLLIQSSGRRLAVLTLYGVAASLLFAVTDPRTPMLRVYENPIILEFVAGAWLGYLYVSGYLARIDARIGLVAFVLGAVGLPVLHIKYSEFQFLWHGAPAALMVFGALVIEARGRLPNSRIMRIVGDSSYSIYLVNAAFLSAFNLVILRLHLPVERIEIGAPLVLLGLFGATLAGYVVYRVIERPAIDRLSRLAFKRREPIASGAAWTSARADSRIGV